MIHGVKNTKFKNGQDSNTMIMRKLMINFLKSSTMVTSEARGKALKSYLDRILSKTKEKTEANKNYLLRYFPNSKIIDVLFNQVGKSLAGINGGYTKLVRLNTRSNDGSMMVRAMWAHPVIIEWGDKKNKKTSKKEVKKATAESKEEKVVKTETK